MAPVGDEGEFAHALHVQIPEVSLVKVVGTTSLSLALLAPIEAGESVTTTVVDSSCWLNYSVIKGGVTRPRSTIRARITDGVLPDGLRLRVVAGSATGGDGQLGVPGGAVELSSAEQNVITAIGSSYTGKGEGQGHRLLYELSLKKSGYDQLDFEQSETLEITYTISD